MASDWRVVRLEELAERVAMGPFGSSIKVETFVPHGVPIISGQHLRYSRLDETVSFNFITVEHAERLRNANVRRGDVIFTHAGNIGQVSYIPADSKFERYVISQRQFYLRPDTSRILPDFVTAYFKTPEGQHKLLANTSQVGVPSIARPVSYLRTIEIAVPPLPEQRAIAHILGTLDDKIELNRRMSETLEAMARALFKSWFVDFDPVRAKAAGRDPGLPRHIADLFPDRLVESELGEIPEGWEVGTLASLSSLNPESWTRDTRGPHIKYVDLSNVKRGRVEAVMNYAATDAPSRAQRVLRPGDTIVGTVRPGNASYALVTEPGLTASTGFAVLRPHKVAYVEFVFLAATGPDSIDTLAHLADGAAYPAVRPEVVAATRVVRPKDEVFERFSRLVGPAFSRYAQGERESRVLIALRDALLPKLISGDLRIKDAERFVAEAVS